MEISRRTFLSRTGRGLSGLTLGSLWPQQVHAATAAPIGRTAEVQALLAQAAAPLTARRPTAQRLIVLFLSGGPSQLDLFDPKPLLDARHGEELPASLRHGIDGSRGPLRLMGSPFRFQRHGESGIELSELLPQLGTMADDITLVRSLCTDPTDHETAQGLLLHDGRAGHRRPWSAWIGNDPPWSHSPMPERASLGARDDLPPLHDAPEPSLEYQRETHFLWQPGGKGVPPQDPLPLPPHRNRREQMVRLTDLRGESPQILARYGAEADRPSFAGNCLRARRLVERGTRFVLVGNAGWDHHDDLPQALRRKCAEVDRPMAALLWDLKSRGLLHDTIVIGCGEFGRAPFGDPTTAGRAHNHRAASLWLAGGGCKAGAVIGRTDEFGMDVVETPIHVRDLQATVRHCLGVPPDAAADRGRVMPALLA